MKRLTRTLPILLAAALQIMPLVRNLFINPAAGSSFAFILRWGIGAGAALETVDAVSGASVPVTFSSPTNFLGTVGTYFSNNVTIANNKADPGAYFVLTNSLGHTDVTPGALTDGKSTTVCMPPGLTFKCYDGNNGNNSTPLPIYGAMYGTPTTPVTNFWIRVEAGHPAVGPSGIIITNIYITFQSAGTAPVITNNPVGMTNVAGGNATFTVTAGGSPAVAYQWRLISTNLYNATNASLTLTNIRNSQAGGYTVVITNSVGSITSSIASLTVTNPNPPTITTPVNNAGLFQFTFVPVVGLTNSVQTNGVLSGGTWATLTNVPPPANANLITVTDPLGSSNRFYRVLILP